MRAYTITECIEPACPWACSAEPARVRTKWPCGGRIDGGLRTLGAVADERARPRSVATLEPVGLWHAQPLAATAR